MRRTLSHFRRQKSGSASVEFAFIASFLLAVMAILVDLTQALARTRDASVFAGQIALAIAQVCPNSACVADAAQMVKNRRHTILPTVDSVDIEIYDVVKVSGSVKGATADVAGLPGEVFDAAQLVMREGDTAVAVRVLVPANSLLAGFLPRDKSYGSSLARIAVAIRSSGGN